MNLIIYGVQLSCNSCHYISNVSFMSIISAFYVAQFKTLWIILSFYIVQFWTRQRCRQLSRHFMSSKFELIIYVLDYLVILYRPILNSSNMSSIISSFHVVQFWTRQLCRHLSCHFMSSNFELIIYIVNYLVTLSSNFGLVKYLVNYVIQTFWQARRFNARRYDLWDISTCETFRPANLQNCEMVRPARRFAGRNVLIPWHFLIDWLLSGLLSFD